MLKNFSIEEKIELYETVRKLIIEDIKAGSVVNGLCSYIQLYIKETYNTFLLTFELESGLNLDEFFEQKPVISPDIKRPDRDEFYGYWYTRRKEFNDVRLNIIENCLTTVKNQKDVN